MIETGQVWASDGRDVLVLDDHYDRVMIRDAYGSRRSLTKDELEHGFRNVTDHAERVRGVMACQKLADVMPA